MADHIRQQLRGAVATAVTGLTTTGTRVYPYRVYALQPGTELPCVSVYVTGEEASGASVGTMVEREVTVHVRGFAAGATVPDNTLDQIAKEIETVLAGGVTISGRAVTLMYRGCDIEFEAADKPYGAIDLRFAAMLFNAASAPDAPL